MLRQSVNIIGLVVVVTSSAFTAEGQMIPGYLGQRNVTAFQAELWPSVIGLGRSQDKAFHNYTSLNSNYALSHQRVISRRFTLFFKLGFTQSNIKPIDYFANTTSGHKYYPNGDPKYDEEPFENVSNTPFSSLEFTLGFRSYHNGTAPLGRYFGFHVNYAKLSSIYNFSNYFTADSERLQLLNSSTTDIESDLFRLSVEYGKTAIYLDRLAIDFGIQLSIPLASSEAFSGLLDYDKSYPGVEFDDSNPKGYEESVSDYLGIAYMTNTYILFRIGIGVVY